MLIDFATTTRCTIPKSGDLESELMPIDAQLADAIFRKSRTMMLLSLEDGRIIDANPAFLDWIGYSMHEFTRQRDPVSWHDITLPDAALEADIEQSRACAAGEVTNYKLRKHYQPKGQAPRLVDIYVQRHPPQGQMNCFLVEVYPIGQEKEECLLEVMTTNRKLAESITKIQTSMDTLVAGNIATWMAWGAKNPRVSVPLALLICFLLFGRSTLEIVEACIKLIRWETQ